MLEYLTNNIGLSSYLHLHHGSFNTSGTPFFQFGSEAKRCDMNTPKLGLRQNTLQKNTRDTVS